MKTPVINTDDYTVYLEHFSNNTFIHCDCYRWTKTVKQQLKADFDKLVDIHGKPIFAIHETNDSKHLRFLNMMNFKYHSEFIGDDKHTRQLFVRVK